MLCAVLGAIVVPNAGSAQDSCSYDSCALRVKRSLIGHRIVQGQHEEPVASIVVFAPRLQMWSERSDSADTHYAAFRARHNAGAIFSLVGLAAFATGTVLALSDRGSETIPLVTVIGGLTFTVVGFAFQLDGRNHLSRAIWWYNSTLSDRGFR